MQQLIKDGLCTVAKPIITSHNINTEKSRTFSIQMITKPQDLSTAATSVGWLQGSNNKVDWINIAKCTTTGTGIMTDGGPFEALWGYMRFRLEQTTPNCPVDVYLSLREI